MFTVNTHVSAMMDLRTASMGGNEASGSGANDLDSLY